MNFIVYREIHLSKTTEPSLIRPDTCVLILINYFSLLTTFFKNNSPTPLIGKRDDPFKKQHQKGWNNLGDVWG